MMILADDLTGALDTGAQISKHGVAVTVTSDLDANPPHCQVAIFNTDSRHDSPQTAYDKTHRLLTRWRDAAELFYLKTDSALRGNIAASFAAAMDCLAVPLLFIPAFPQVNRITQNGYHYIDGTLLESSVFAQDPRNPMTQSYIPDILESNWPLKVQAIGESTSIHWDYQRLSDKTAVVFDCSSQSKLEELFHLLHSQNALRLTSGCAGWASSFTPLIKKLPRRPHQQQKSGSPLFVVCGSANAKSTEQIMAAEQSVAKVIHLAPHLTLSPSPQTLAQELSSSIINSLNSGQTVVAATVCRPEDKSSTDALATKQHLSPQQVHQRIADALSTLAKEVVENAPQLTLCVFGGDTALSILDLMSCDTIYAQGEVELGVPISQIHCGQRKIQLITKSGGLGSRNVIQNIQRYLKGEEIQ